jgi:hypothetical protein
VLSWQFQSDNLFDDLNGMHRQIWLVHYHVAFLLVLNDKGFG